MDYQANVEEIAALCAKLTLYTRNCYKNTVKGDKQGVIAIKHTVLARHHEIEEQIRKLQLDLRKNCEDEIRYVDSIIRDIDIEDTFDNELEKFHTEEGEITEKRKREPESLVQLPAIIKQPKTLEWNPICIYIEDAATKKVTPVKFDELPSFNYKRDLDMFLEKHLGRIYLKRVDDKYDIFCAIVLNGHVFIAKGFLYRRSFNMVKDNYDVQNSHFHKICQYGSECIKKSNCKFAHYENGDCLLWTSANATCYQYQTNIYYNSTFDNTISTVLANILFTTYVALKIDR